MSARDKQEIKVGFAGNYKRLEVDVAAGDILPWDADTKFETVGTDVDRIDGVAKVTGKAVYASDANFAGLLFGRILRSPWPKAKVVKVDLAAAKKMPGVKAVMLTRANGTPFQVRWIGDDIAAVAAETRAQAEDALEKIVVEYEVLSHNTDYLKAKGAPEINDVGEVTTEWAGKKKAVIETTLKDSDVTCTGTYRTEVQTHCSLEPHGLTAKWDKDRKNLEVWASVQANMGVPRHLKRGLANFGIRAGEIRSHSEFVGGGFGSKFSPGPEGLTAAALAYHAKAPVRLMLDRYEEQTCAGNRPSALMSIRIGAKLTGEITAFDFRSWGGSGHAGRGGRAVPPRHYSPRETSQADMRDLRSDTDAARPMRAPGFPQGFFGAEVMIDELAEALAMDPLALRLKNDVHEVRRAEWAKAAAKFGWAKRRETGKRDLSQRKLRGAGMGSATWHQMGRPGNRIICRIHSDGLVELRSGAQDIGTGMKTVMAMIGAEELGLKVGQIRAVMGDSRDPVGPASGGSTTTPSLAPTVRHAVASAKAELAALVAKHLKVDVATVGFHRGKVGVEGGKNMTFKDACKLIQNGVIETNSQRFRNYKGYQSMVCGCQFAEVEVDTKTGRVRVIEMLGVQDCGLVIAKKLAESQVLGAMIQGFSFALHEQRIIDHAKGRVVNGDMLYYKIATSSDTPKMEAMMFDVANGMNNVGAAGLGEPPAVAAPAAIANAVYNAIGVPVRSLPITPDKVLAALATRVGKK